MRYKIYFEEGGTGWVSKASTLEDAFKIAGEKEIVSDHEVTILDTITNETVAKILPKEVL